MVSERFIENELLATFQPLFPLSILLSLAAVAAVVVIVVHTEVEAVQAVTVHQLVEKPLVEAAYWNTHCLCSLDCHMWLLLVPVVLLVGVLAMAGQAGIVFFLTSHQKAAGKAASLVGLLVLAVLVVVVRGMVLVDSEQPIKIMTEVITTLVVMAAAVVVLGLKASEVAEVAVLHQASLAHQ